MCSDTMWLTHDDVQCRGHGVVGAHRGEADTVCWTWNKQKDCTMFQWGEEQDVTASNILIIFIKVACLKKNVYNNTAAPRTGSH